MPGMETLPAYAALERWHVFTDEGRRVTWSPTAEDAQRKAEAQGLQVERVEPALRP